MRGRALAAAEQADAADEPHGGWKVSKVSYLHLKSASQLIRGVGRSIDRELCPNLSARLG